MAEEDEGFANEDIDLLGIEIDDQPEEDFADEDDNGDILTHEVRNIHHRTTQAEIYLRRGNIPGLSLYEAVAIIKNRAKKLYLGKAITVLPEDFLSKFPRELRIDPVFLAKEEFKRNCLTGRIGRIFEDGSVAYLNIADLRKKTYLRMLGQRPSRGNLPV